MSDITVADDKTGASWPDEGEAITLRPGESRKFITSYKVTEADVLSGEVENTATASAVASDQTELNGSDQETTPIAQANASLSVAKTAAPAADGKETYSLGETVVYTITVTNNGNVTVSDIAVTDDLTKGSWTIDSLAPGASKEFTTEYSVKEADITNGSVQNTADAKGKDPNGKEVTEDGSTTIPTDAKDYQIESRNQYAAERSI